MNCSDNFHFYKPVRHPLRCRKGEFNLAPPTAIFGLISILFAILLPDGTATAANWYVRPVAQGSATGKDWNNAWSTSGIGWGSVKPGDTLWLAGGSYNVGLTVSAGGTSAAPLNIWRATNSDASATATVGWESSFDSQVKLPGADGILIPAASYINVDGRTAYGILITIDKNGGPGIECNTSRVNQTNLSFRNIDINGGYWSASNPAQDDVRGFKISPSTGSLSNVLIDHCRIRGVDLGIHCLASNVTVQYCTIQDIWRSDPTQHPDVLYCYPSPNMVWRYNFIINCETDGVFFEFGGADHFYFYGNVYYSTTNHMIFFKQGGSDTYGPFFIFNNTFQAPGTGSYQFGYLSANDSPLRGASQVYNNIFYNVENSFSGLSGVTSDYNAYNYESLGGYGWPSNEAHSFTFTGSPFIGLPPYTQPVTTIGDFHLTSALQALFQNGLPLTRDGFINLDADGSQRGSGGRWHIGAYQYSGGTPIPTPMAPTSLHIVSPP
jgi:hypothetical protein